MKVAVFVPKHAKMGEGFSKRERLQAEESPGRYTDPKLHGYQSAATWIDDRVQRRLNIMLCSFCRHKFDPKKYNYRRAYVVGTERPDPFRFDGKCEDCKEETMRSPGGGTYFVPEEIYQHVYHEPPRTRAGGRWGLWNPFNYRSY
jgi:hypothetical protein